jgi:hypothetical protein
MPPVGSTLPVFPPVRPDNTLPAPEGGGATQPPQISLPIVLPPGAQLGEKFDLKYSPLYGWVLVPVSEPPTTAEPKG